MSFTPMRFAHTRRSPCRKGEYIVISLTGATMIVTGAPSAREALRFRLSFVRRGTPRTYFVTTGQVTARYDVKANGTFKPWPDQWWEEEL